MPRKEAIQVVGRFRPLNSMERESGENEMVVTVDEARATVSVRFEEHTHDFAFDVVLPASRGQDEVHARTCDQIIQCVRGRRWMARRGSAR